MFLFVGSTRRHQKELPGKSFRCDFCSPSFLSENVFPQIICISFKNRFHSLSPFKVPLTEFNKGELKYENGKHPEYQSFYIFIWPSKGLLWKVIKFMKPQANFWVYVCIFLMGLEFCRVIPTMSKRIYEFQCMDGLWKREQRNHKQNIYTFIYNEIMV